MGKWTLWWNASFLVIAKNVIMGQSFQFEFTHDFELQDHNVFMCVQEYNVFLSLI